MKADDLYTKVTNDIIARIEAGAGTWTMPWTRLGNGTNPMRLTGQPYRGINWLILSCEQVDRGFKSNQWGTFNAWKKKGTLTPAPTKKNPEGTTSTVNVRKGEKGTAVFLWKKEKASAAMLARDPDAKEYLLVRTFYVFNRDQVDGLPELPVVELPQHERWEQADTFFQTIGANVVEDGNRAYYAPANDRIAVPTLAQFVSPDHFYSTMAHEHGHWTGHKDRLNRDLHNRFGDEAYAFEELIAELSSAFWCAQFGMEPAKRQDHAAYIQSWLRVLRNDKKAIVTAASKAQAAIDYLNTAAGFSGLDVEEDCEMAVAS